MTNFSWHRWTPARCRTANWPSMLSSRCWQARPFPGRLCCPATSSRRNRWRRRPRLLQHSDGRFVRPLAVYIGGRRPMPNLDFFILIGFVLCVGGLSSAMRGQWTSTPKHSHKTVVVYEGSALGYVVALMGLIIGLLGASQHFSRPFVTHDQAFKYIGYAFIGGILVSAVLIVVNLF